MRRVARGLISISIDYDAISTGATSGLVLQRLTLTNISALGPLAAISKVQHLVEVEPHLMAYSGAANEGQELQWIDIHHSEASKGNAVQAIKQDLGVKRVICFGDSDNDLSIRLAIYDEKGLSSCRQRTAAQCNSAEDGEKPLAHRWQLF